MKFTIYLLKHLIPEWILMYLNYPLLKCYLSVCGALKDFLVITKKTQTMNQYNQIKKHILGNTYLLSKIETDNKEFSEQFINQINKVKRFINVKYNDMKEKTVLLQMQIHQMKMIKNSVDDANQKYNEFAKSQIRVSDQATELKDQIDGFQRNREQLKNQFFKLYHEGILFDQYMQINNEGIRKILKKYTKKMIKIVRQNNYDVLRQQADQLQINSFSIKVKQILYAVEKMLISQYYQDQPELCKSNLRRYMIKTENKGQTWFVFGFSSGLCIMMIAILISVVYEQQNEITSISSIILDYFPVCRGVLLILLFYWAIVADVWFWNRNKINYRQFFQFNYHFSTNNQLLQRAMTLTAITLIILVIYICQLSQIGKVMNEIQFISPIYLLLLLWIVFLVFAFYPTRGLNWEGRLWLFRKIKDGFIINRVKLTQSNLFVTEQFTALIIPFSDFNYSICKFYNASINQDENFGYCYDKTLYITMSISLLIYIVFLVQLILSQVQTKFSISQSLRAFQCVTSILVINLSIYLKSENFISETILFTSINSIILIIIWIVEFWYLKNPIKYNNGPKLFQKYLNEKDAKYFYFYLILIIPLSINQSYSLSSNWIAQYSNMEISYTITLIGFLEIFRRSFINYLLIEREHRKNQDAFNTVGQYEFPFT
ncbi:hypothetical protein pb186bvf_014496, partial [Paramecium bursaria]